MSLLLFTVTLRGVSNKHCLLSLFLLNLQIQEMHNFLREIISSYFGQIRPQATVN